MAKMKIRVGYKVIAITLVISIITLMLGACGQKADPPAVSQDALASLQQNKYLVSKLWGYMTFDFGGLRTISYQTSLETSSVELFWAGQVFNGKSEINGNGYTFTEQIFGSVSDDGQWLTQLTYSREIQRTSDFCDYTVVLKNVPLVTPTSSTTDRTVYQKTGDVEKYVQQIYYKAMGILAGSVVPATTYVSTDWQSTEQPPVLTLAFEKVASISLAGAIAGGVGH